MNLPATIAVAKKYAVPQPIIVQLENGERKDQKTFHTWYETTPEGFKAELIQGEVFMPSPLRLPHSEHQAKVIFWSGYYEMDTPGTRVRDNATSIVDDESEPQPDAALVIDPEYGGQSRVTEDDYAAGPPELIVEVAASSG